MGKCWSLHLGVNAIDERFYGYKEPLDNCINDMRLMGFIAKSRGFKTKFLSSPKRNEDELASKKNLISHLLEVSNENSGLGQGDVFLLTFAGHGFSLPNTCALDSEADGRDECWALYDKPIIDDEIYYYLRLISGKGAKVIIISDSCHSGTVTRISPLVQEGSRQLSEDFVNDFLSRNSEWYKSFHCDINGGNHSNNRGTIVLLSACQDDEETKDSMKYCGLGLHESTENGAFTYIFSKIIEENVFNGFYKIFFDELKSRCNAYCGTTPKLYILPGYDNKWLSSAEFLKCK